MIESIVMGIIIGKLFAYVFAGSFFLMFGKLVKEIGVMAIENWPYTLLFIISYYLIHRYRDEIIGITTVAILYIPCLIAQTLWNSFLFAPIRAIWKILCKITDVFFTVLVKIHGLFN